MGFQISPGVNISEIDLTTVVPAVATTEGAIAGLFNWGPINRRVLIDSEQSLYKLFGKPTNYNAETYYTAASFLAYGNQLYVVRAGNTVTTNTAIQITSATANTAAISEDPDTYSVKNEDNYDELSASAFDASIVYIARYPGTFGNSLKVSVCDSANAYNQNVFAFANTTLGGSVKIDQANVSFVVGSNSATLSANSDAEANSFYNMFTIGDIITVGNTDLGFQELKLSTLTKDQETITKTFNASSSVNSAGWFAIANSGFANGQAVTYLVAAGNTNLTELSNNTTYYVKSANTSGFYLSTTPPGDTHAIITITPGSSETGHSFDTQQNIVRAFNANTGVQTVNSSFNASSAVNATADFITIASNPFANNDVVRYLVAASNTALTNLANDTVYYVVGANTTGIQLSTSRGGSAINLSAGSSETGHTFVLADFISVSNNPYSNGDLITYSTDTGNTAVTGLTGDTNYYVVKANTSGVKISSTSTGYGITLTPGASETGHFITKNGPGSDVIMTFERPFQLATNVTVTSSSSVVSHKFERSWEYYNLVDKAPGRSTFVDSRNANTAVNDEVHIIVADEDGLFTGVRGQVLEKWEGLSRATDAVKDDGATNYYKTVLNQSSNWIWWANHRSGASAAAAVSLTGSTNTKPLSLSMVNGSQGSITEGSVNMETLTTAYDLFKSAEDVDISLVLQGKAMGGTHKTQLANYIIDNICEFRKDCVVFISPDKDDVVQVSGSFEVDNVSTFKNAINSSSYAVVDSGYKYAYDKYNDVYRWVPLNGDIAGLCVRTDNLRDPWFSPAGYNRGQIKNVVRLAYNPRKADRDALYKIGVNPVITQPGQGTILFGDKTALSKPSAFDRINVRRLFIVLEKAIATAAKFTLFEFNDEFTRAQFRNLVEPFLRDVQGRRGIYDFRVVCDGTNNTPEIIDRNEFVGDIYIKPARSINFIQLNFIAVRTGVEFNEVVGKF